MSLRPRREAVSSRPTDQSVAIVRETQNGVRPMSGAQNEATAMAFGGPRSSCVHPGAHSARRQDSHNDWTPYRRAEPTRGSSHFARRLRSLAFLCSSGDGREVLLSVRLIDVMIEGVLDAPVAIERPERPPYRLTEGVQ